VCAICHTNGINYEEPDDGEEEDEESLAETFDDLFVQCWACAEDGLVMRVCCECSFRCADCEAFLCEDCALGTMRLLHHCANPDCPGSGNCFGTVCEDCAEFCAGSCNNAFCRPCADDGCLVSDGEEAGDGGGRAGEEPLFCKECVCAHAAARRPAKRSRAGAAKKTAAAAPKAKAPAAKKKTKAAANAKPASGFVQTTDAHGREYFFNAATGMASRSQVMPVEALLEQPKPKAPKAKAPAAKNTKRKT
jgi:hypothetical protein